MITVVVDAANVMGSRPDGWWRDRAGAAVRLHNDLMRLAERGVRVPVPESASGPSAESVSASASESVSESASGSSSAEFVLVLEGAAQAALPRITPGKVRVVTSGGGSGDDAIVKLVRELAGQCVVVTADRELRRRCEALGASILGPGWLLALFRQ